MFLGLVRMLYALCGSQGIDSREVTNYLTARHRLTRNHADSFAVPEWPRAETCRHSTGVEKHYATSWRDHALAGAATLEKC
jgi:hypothetical protein